jgi:hypothetical protein
MSVCGYQLSTLDGPEMSLEYHAYRLPPLKGQRNIWIECCVCTTSLSENQDCILFAHGVRGQLTPWRRWKAGESLQARY